MRASNLELLSTPVCYAGMGDQMLHATILASARRNPEHEHAGLLSDTGVMQQQQQFLQAITELSARALGLAGCAHSPSLASSKTPMSSSLSEPAAFFTAFFALACSQVRY